MRLRSLTCVLFLLTQIFSHTLFSQVTLDDFIGLDAEPADDDAVCEIPMFPDVDEYLDDLLEGNLIPDFKLFTPEGIPVQASEILGEKPALFISGSYTCFVFRSEIDVINMVQSIYGDEVNIYVIYTVEAHPIIDPSPYWGYEVVGDPNYDEGVLYEQPETYGQRKILIDSMLAHYEIDVPILMDGPCNEWWLNFGTNPNCAYLVAPDGIVFDAQEWFDRYPDDILASIDSLLTSLPSDTSETDTTGTDTTTTLADGDFLATFEDGCIEGEAGETIIVHGNIISADDSAASFVDVMVLSEDLPAGWESSICTDICYPPDVVVATAYADIGDTTSISVYFFTNETPGEGEVQVFVRNHYIPGTGELFSVKACVAPEEPEDTTVLITTQQSENMMLFPNPAENILHVFSTSVEKGIITIYDVSGKKVSETEMPAPGETIIDVSAFASGIYQIELENNETTVVKTLIVK